MDRLLPCMTWYSEFDWLWKPVRVPKPFSALPPRQFSGKASPLAISRRTSYHQVRLAFHSDPQLIR
jgi:hypothetical protein